MTKEWWINWFTSQEEWFLDNYRRVPKLSELFFKMACEHRIEFQHGCSKGCIIDLDADFVIKWTIEDGNDEMTKEYEVYKKAVAHGLECFFPKTELLFELGGWLKIFAQERVTTTVCEMSLEDYNKCKNSLPFEIQELVYDDFEEFDFYWRPEDTLWIKKAIMDFGRQKVFELASFTRKYRINDLHDRNIGFNGVDFTPLLLDFSGYGMGTLRSYSF